ncbi:MAG: ATP-binding protein [Fibromonadales bacterium]|nr:ATP-binding protein [Fibromonadales bacterium]
MPRKLPSGVQTFRKVREDFDVYVDKTQFIFNMIDRYNVVFLSRPRRFGKSLTCSTLEAIFKNERELFKGLYIDSSPWKWQEYPIVRIDLASGDYTRTEAVLLENLEQALRDSAKNYNIEISGESLPMKFENLLKDLHRSHNRVAVIIDEYDNPLLSTTENKELNEEHRNILKGFYSVLKKCDAHIKFAFITGVTKFSQVSVFSGMNQPEDISLNSDFSAICGITQEELENSFASEIEEYAERHGGKEKYLEKLKNYYDGYRFSEKEIFVYNPTSLIKHFLNNSAFRNYWSSTGNPSFLVKYLESKTIEITDLENAELTPETFANYRSDDLDLVPILYQAGYLTIASYDDITGAFKLKYPNAEIRNSFASFLEEKVSNVSMTKQSSSVTILIKALYAGDVKTFIETMQVYLSGVDYSLITRITEHYFEFAFSNILNMLGVACKVEKHNAVGSVDAVVEIGDYVYVIEAKLDKPVEAALKQIEDKGYALPYKNGKKKVVKLGVKFCSEKRNITNWKVA